MIIQMKRRVLWKLILAVMQIPILSSAVFAQVSSTRASNPSPSGPSISSGTAVPADPGAIPIAGTQTAPNINVPASETFPFERGQGVLSLPSVLRHQWSPTREVPAESIISRGYLRTRSRARHSLTLKQAVFIAMMNNPAVKVARLNPIAAQENVNMQWAEFDPDTTANIGTIYSVFPATTPFETFGGVLGLETREYEWNFAVSKILSTTNGTLTAQFNNLFERTNNLTQTVNPFYNPVLQLSISQPLLRNFGWKFATLNVAIAESQQKQAQWAYVQALEDFVQRVANDYWNLVRAEENLRVAQESLKFNEDLVRQNTISLKVGTLAPIDVQEAQSAAETARANVYTAEANLQSARVVLRQDVMLNPKGLFIPDDIEAADKPNPNEQIKVDLDDALEKAVMYRPSLHNLRETIQMDLLQVRFQENQLLPQLNAQAQFGITNESGNVECGPTFGLVTPNCIQSVGTEVGQPGYQFPFKGEYGSALSKMFDFAFYNYAAFFSWEMQMDNATAKAALAQTKIIYEQQRMQYRDLLSQIITEVESSIANLRADLKRVVATAAATDYARQALRNEQQRFKVGMATTHDLLQFEQELVNAEGNQVQAEVDLEEAKIQLLHAEGRLLSHFGIDFELQDPHTNIPWYGRF